MDNLTHSLVGLTLAKAGLEKLSPGATAVCLLAANSPDADILALAGGRWFYLQNHRGITHSILGAAVLAIALPLIFYLIDLLISSIRKRPGVVRFRGLMLASVIATATHPLLDWTNNYGVRFLLPWDARWFYGDLVFIMDPVMWLVLGGATFLVTANSRRKLVFWIVIASITTLLVLIGPVARAGLANAWPLRLIWISALVALVILHKRQSVRSSGTKLPRGALALITLYLAALAGLHAIAFNQLTRVASQVVAANERPLAMAAMPTLANPLRWLCVIATEKSAYRFELVLGDSEVPPGSVVSFPQPQSFVSPLMDRADDDYRAQVFLNFARFPVANIADPNCTTQTLVQFADLRYTEPGSQRGTFTVEVPVSCDDNVIRSK
ncbi:MAG TPA: metal-dependent hydrolase [Pyrinomonadaceae bacterium]|nr:metal-dependent hydrolase [Pyrinomonadaceae bacterium]